MGVESWLLEESLKKIHNFPADTRSVWNANMFRPKCTQPGVGSVSIFADPTLTETSKVMEMSPVLPQDTSSMRHLYLYFVMFPGNTDCLMQVEMFT